jgi:hypothetical protein
MMLSVMAERQRTGHFNLPEQYPYLAGFMELVRLIGPIV